MDPTNPDPQHCRPPHLAGVLMDLQDKVMPEQLVDKLIIFLICGRVFRLYFMYCIFAIITTLFPLKICHRVRNIFTTYGIIK